MKKWTRSFITGGGFLVACLMTGNVLNFVYNAYLGRALNFEEFGLITLINTLTYIVSIFLIALTATVNHTSAFLAGKEKKIAGIGFLQRIQRKTIIITLTVTALWIIAIPFMAEFFQVESLYPLLWFSPIIFFSAAKSNNRGFLQGNMFFSAVGIILLSESLSKLVAAYAIITLGYPSLTYLSITFSSLISFICAYFFTRQKVSTVKEPDFPHHPFPFRFFLAAVLSGLSTNAFLTFDITLVKHYLSPELAGQYALLSLIGKMIFFVSSLVNIFVITLVSRDEGAHKNSHETFYKIFIVILIMVSVATILLGYFGKLFVPFLFGSRSLVIVQFLERYTLTIMFFTLANTIATYQLAREKYLFTILSLIMSSIMIAGIMFRHSGIYQIISIMYAVSIMNLSLMFALHLILRRQLVSLKKLISLVKL